MSACRSDCRAPHTMRSVVAVSASGRVWVGQVCDDDEHMADTLRAVKELGFTVKSIDLLEAPA